MAVGARRIAQQQAQLLAVRQQPQAFAARQQHTLRAAHRAEAVGAPGPMRRIEIGFGAERPGTQPGTARRCISQPPSSIPSRVATSGCRTGRSNPRRSASGATTWLQTLCGPPLERSCRRSACQSRSNVLPRPLASNPSLISCVGQFEPNERLRQRGAGKRAVTQVQVHAGGTSISMPTRCRARRRQCRTCRTLGAAALEQLDDIVRLATPCRRVVGVGRERGQPVQRRGQRAPVRAIRSRTEQVSRARDGHTADLIGAPAQPVLQVACLALDPPLMPVRDACGIALHRGACDRHSPPADGSAPNRRTGPATSPLQGAIDPGCRIAATARAHSSRPRHRSAAAAQR